MCWSARANLARWRVWLRSVRTSWLEVVCRCSRLPAILSFMVPTRSRVREVHALACRRGDEILDPARHFPQYPQPYFATFWLDPHGFKLEAVCHHDAP